MSNKLKLTGKQLRKLSIEKKLDPIVKTPSQVLPMLRRAAMLGFSSYSFRVVPEKIPNIVKFLREKTDLKYWGPVDIKDDVIEVQW